MFKIEGQKDSIKILGITDEISEQKDSPENTQGILIGILFVFFFMVFAGSISIVVGFILVLCFSGILALFTIDAAHENPHRSKVDFVADRKTEQLLWLGDKGRETKRKVFFSDITAVRVSMETEYRKEDKTRELKLYPISLVNKAGQRFRILRSEEKEEVLAAADKLAKFINRPLQVHNV